MSLCLRKVFSRSSLVCTARRVSILFELYRVLYRNPLYRQRFNGGDYGHCPIFNAIHGRIFYGTPTSRNFWLGVSVGLGGISLDIMEAASEVDTVILLSGDGDFDLLLQKNSSKVWR